MRRMLLLSALCALLLVGVSQAFAVDTSPLGFWTCPAGLEGQELKVFNWTTYIAEDTISNFEELCGVSVSYDTYASDTEMLECLEQATCQYDVVVPTDSTVYVMVGENLLQPLDKNNIPNLANVTDELKNPPYDPDNVYTVPYQWGTVGIGYNKTKVGREITSWRDFFGYQGSVAWLDDDRAMLGTALLVQGLDPNTDQSSEVAQAEEWLKNKATNLKVIAPDDGQDRLANGEVDMVIEYSGDIYQIIADCNCDDYAYVIPEEGARVWVDNMAIPAVAEHKELAEAFLDYILDLQVGADVSNFTAYASPNNASIQAGLIDEQYLDNPSIYPDSSIMQHLFFVISSPTLAPIYSDAWQQLKTSLGK